MNVIPPSVTMGGLDTVTFQALEAGVPVPGVQWSLVPQGRGFITDAGVYSSPKFIFLSRKATIVATANNQSSTATVVLSPARTWVVALTFYWIVLAIGIMSRLYSMWPADATMAKPEDLVIGPAAVTLRPKGTQQFVSNMAVNWSSNAPNGLYTAGAAPKETPDKVTATSVADPAKTATASVYVNAAGSFVITPSLATLRPGQPWQFKPVTDPADLKITWGDFCADDGTCTAPQSSSGGNQTVTVTAKTDKTAMTAAAAIRVIADTGTAAGPSTQTGILQVLKIIFLFGALGGLLHGVVSMVAYVGSTKFEPSWGPYYIFQPFVGGVIALMVYLVPTAASSDPAASLSVKGGIAALVGLFSDLALQKLKEVFDALIGPRSDPRTQKLEGAATAKPAISSIVPQTIIHATNPPPSVRITGTGFAEHCTGRVNDSARPTVRQSDTTVTVTLTAPDIAQANTTLVITVVNPDGDVSNAVNVQVT